MEVWLSGLADIIIYFSKSSFRVYGSGPSAGVAATLIHAHVAPGTAVYTFRPVGSIQSSFQPLDPAYPPIILSTSQ